MVSCSPLRFGNASFPYGAEGDVADSNEKCPINTTRGGTPIARAVCVNETTSGELVWNVTEYLSDCGPFRGTSQVITDIIQTGVTNETVIEALEVVAEVTNMELDEEDIVNIADIIDKSTALQNGNPMITSLTTTIINDFADRDEEELFDVEENTGAISQILESFEEQLNIVDVSDGETFSAVEMNIAVQVTSVEPAEFVSGLTVYAGTDTTDLRQSNITFNPGDSTNQPSDLKGTRVTIPATVISDLSNDIGNETGVRVSLSVFRTSSLFSSRRIRETNAGQESFNRSVNSLVIGLALGGMRNLANLRENIVFRYSPVQSGFQDPECVFWDFENTNDWSSRGCQRVTSSSDDNALYDETDEIECSCNHLTNFAVLMDVYARRIEALRIISIIGCAISIVSLIIVLLTYLSNKSLRVHQSQKIFICLCATLLCLYITFVIMSALDRYPNHREVKLVPCSILAALVHFFTLSSLAWMGVEGFNTYLIVVRVFDAYIPRFMLLAGLVAWGLPGLVVVITGGAARENYADSDFCFLQRWPLVGGLLIPIALILLVNIIIFSLVVRRLIKSANVAAKRHSANGTSRKESIERVKNAVSVLLLLGLTWITGYLTLIDSSSQVIQTLFIVFNALQGFFIFILYCARNPVVRAYWAKACGCGQDSSKASTGANLGTSQGTSNTNTRRFSSSVNFSQVEKGDDLSKATSGNNDSASHDNPAFDVSEVEIGEDPTARSSPENAPSVLHENPTYESSGVDTGDGLADVRVDPANEKLGTKL